jgi:hypothetical protein
LTSPRDVDGIARRARGLTFPAMTMMWWMRATVTAAVLLAGACAGKSAEPARPGVSPEPSPPPAASPAPSPGGAASDEPRARPVGTKLLRDVDESPKAFKLAKNDGSGHGLGKVSLTVDGRNVWPPEGPGCPEMVRCCTDLVTADESLALACLLAVGRDPDCPTALRTSLAIAGESNVPPPAACPR